MAKPVLKLISPKDKSPRLELVLFPQDNSKKGYGGYLKTLKEDSDQPPRRVAMFVNKYDDGNINFALKAPIRKVSQGELVMSPRRNKDGDYLDDKGNIVDESKASESYTFVRDEDDKLVFGVVCNLWITNTKKDKTPTKKTMMSAKFYSDTEMLKMHDESDSEAKKHLRKEMGGWTTLFIEEGFQFLRELGCTVRE